MKITVKLDEFQTALSRVLGVVDKRGTMPILSNVLIKADGNLLEIGATDLEVSYKGLCGAEVTEPGAITVPAHQLFALVKESRVLTATLETTERYSLKMDLGGGRYNLNGLPAEQFPELPAIERGVGVVNIPGKDLAAMINKVLFSAVGDDLQYHLNGVLLEKIGQDEVGETSLRMVSTDGHRLTLIERGFPMAGLLMLNDNGIMIPRKGAMEIAKFSESQESVGLALDKQIFFVIGEGKHLAIRLLDRKFPDYRRIIPPGFEHQFTIPRPEFASTIKRLTLVQTERFKGIVLSLGAEEVGLSSSNPEVGEGAEKIAGVQLLEGDPATLPLEIGFNAPYLLQPVSFMGNGHIIFSTNGPDKPARIMGADDPNYYSIIMPMSR